MVSGTQPDSPATASETTCIYGACNGRNCQDCLDAAETGAGSAAPGLTGSISPKGDFGSGNDDSGELGASLVGLILGLRGLWSLPTRTDATAIADAILARGWRRTSAGDAEGQSESVWRVGRSWGRTIVLQAGDQPAKAAGGDKLIGVMDTPELARLVRDAVNAWRGLVDDATATRVGLAARDAMNRVSTQDGTPAEAWAEIGRAAVQALRDGSGTCE